MLCPLCKKDLSNVNIFYHFDRNHDMSASQIPREVLVADIEASYEIISKLKEVKPMTLIRDFLNDAEGFLAALPPGSKAYHAQVAEPETLTIGAPGSDHQFKMPAKRFRLVLTSYVKDEDLLYQSVLPAALVEEIEEADKLHKQAVDSMTKYLETLKAKRPDITWLKGRLHTGAC